jgi:SPP1 family phage portal protein
MTLKEYIDSYYQGVSDWFVDEVKQPHNITKINDIISKREYLAGKHKIKNSEIILYNGKAIMPTRIVLQYAKTLLAFQVSFLLGKPVTLLSKDENTLRVFKEIYDLGDYDIVDRKILDKMLKYGQVYEYVYLDENNVIKSKLINGEDGFPVFADDGGYLAFIEHYIVNGVSYYTVFTPEEVTTYNDANGQLETTGRYTNVSGLPCIYKTDNPLNEEIGRSEIDDWIDILDEMEKLLSKYCDSFYKFMNPIPILLGEKLNLGRNNEGALDPSAVGYYLALDQGSDFKYAETKMDANSLKQMFQILKQCLLDISMTPAISMNSMEVSNLSEVSIKLLYSLAQVKASMNALYLLDGFKQRIEAMRKLLAYKGVEANGDIDIIFNINMPQSEKDIIDNLKTLKDMGILSDETLLEHVPLNIDIASEKAKLQNRQSGNSE